MVPDMPRPSSCTPCRPSLLSEAARSSPPPPRPRESSEGGSTSYIILSFQNQLYSSRHCVSTIRNWAEMLITQLFFRLKSTSKKHSLSKAPSPPGASGPARRGAEVSWKACEGPLCPAVCWAPAKRPTLSSQASEGPTPSSRSRGRRPRAPGWSEPPAVTELAAGSLTAPPLLGPDAVAAGDRGWRSIPTNEEVFQRGDSAPLRTPGGVQGHAAGA